MYQWPAVPWILLFYNRSFNSLSQLSESSFTPLFYASHNPSTWTLVSISKIDPAPDHLSSLPPWSRHHHLYLDFCNSFLNDILASALGQLLSTPHGSQSKLVKTKTHMTLLIQWLLIRCRIKVEIWGAWVAQSVKCLLLAQVMIPRSWDLAPCLASFSVESLLLPIPLPLP